MTDRHLAEGATLFLLIIGALAMLLAGVGVLRMPDIFMRMQATSKAATLGVGCMMLAVAAYFSDLAVTTRAVAVILFTFLTAPIGAHMIGRAAYIARARLWDGTAGDDLRGRYDTLEERPIPDGDSPPIVGGDRQGRAERHRQRRRRLAARQTSSTAAPPTPTHEPPTSNAPVAPPAPPPQEAEHT